MDERIEKLEKELSELKAGLKSEKKVKVKKQPSEYNLFISNFITSAKTKMGDGYDHKQVFKDAAAEWKLQKDKK